MTITLTNKEKIQNAVDFHGKINWYSLDCYPEKIQKRLQRLPISTYSVVLGNTTCHFFSWDLPKRKDFNPRWNTELASFDDAFFRELRKFIKNSRYFNKSENTIAKAKALTKLTFEYHFEKGLPTGDPDLDCYCHNSLSNVKKFKGSLKPCKSCEKLLDENSGYNPEEGKLADIRNLDVADCDTIEEYIQKYPEQFGYIYKGKIYIRD